MNTATQSIQADQLAKKIDRLQAVVCDLLLVEGKRLNAAQLAERLDISPATIGLERQTCWNAAAEAAHKQHAQSQADARDVECFRFWESSWTMAVAAVRYCLGRGTHIVSDCQEWLCDIWDELPEKAQTIIQRDVEEAFRRDDEDRAAGKDYRALGDACDMLCWEQVRKLWRNEGAE